MQEFFDQVIFQLGQLVISVEQLLQIAGVVVVLTVLSYFLNGRWLPLFFNYEGTEKTERRRIRRMVWFILLLLGLIFMLITLNIDLPIFTFDRGGEEHSITITSLVQVLLVLQLARLFDWLIMEVLMHRLRQNKSESNVYQYGGTTTNNRRASRLVQPVVYVLALMFILEQLNFNRTFFNYRQGDTDIPFTINTLLSALLVIAIVRLMLWIATNLVLHSYYRRNKVNIGSRYAINRLVAYFFYVIGILWALDSLGLELTVLWGGAAALLVGVGLGLQQTFNDLICGVILLFERTVEVGDMVDMDGLVGRVTKIGTRTSLVETRDSITVIVPNSKLVGENVINWSHTERKARFKVSVGVAYGSDTELVRRILVEAAIGHKKILNQPEPFVRFLDFGSSSLDFEVHFWSREFQLIEDVKSDLRFEIDRRFREADITIPFPQRDLWIRNPETLRPASANGESGRASRAVSPPEDEG